MLDELSRPEISAFLFDLGVSSAQLDRPERGFSYRLDGPLDMRMDPSGARTAADIVNGSDERALAGLLRRHADERFSRRIAAAIVAQRPFATTAELARTVAEAVPAPARRHGHPARRTFQALRIEVNGELEFLAPALTEAIERLVGGGRGAVLSYHSGEDRIVKSVFRRGRRRDAAASAGAAAARPRRHRQAAGAAGPHADRVREGRQPQSRRGAPAGLWSASPGMPDGAARSGRRRAQVRRARG